MTHCNLTNFLHGYIVFFLLLLLIISNTAIHRDIEYKFLKKNLWGQREEQSRTCEQKKGFKGIKGEVHRISKHGEFKDDEWSWEVRRGREEVPCGTVVACMDSGGRGSLAKNSSCLKHLFSDKTFVRKMVLFLAKTN